MTKNIKQLFDEYMFECEFVQGLRPKTLQDYRQNFSTFLKLVPDLSLETLNPASVLEFFKLLQERNRVVGKRMVSNGVKKSTILTYWRQFNCFFGWLKIKGYIKINPLTQFKRPTVSYENRQFLKKEEVEKILTSIVVHSYTPFHLKRNLVIFYLLLFCGLRREELLQLQLRDIDIQKRILTVRAETSKVPKTRYVPLHSQTIVSLKDYLKERTEYTTQYLIVSTNRDNRLSNNGLRHLVGTLSLYSGVKFHVHQFRHTFAVNFLKSSNNVAKLQQLLGHKDPSMTLLYVRCLPPHEMRSDIEIMNLDTLI